MNKKTSVLVALSLSVYAALYGHEPPVLSSWIPANPMNKARAFFVAAELPHGDILVAGGFDGNASPPNFADSEMYNRHTGLWTLTAPMNNARSAPVAVQLENGRVLVIGGFNENFTVLNTAEIYDPRSNKWSLTGPLNVARVEDFAAVLLPGRKVLVAGGTASDGTALKSAEIYDEATNKWTPTASMNIGRSEFATVMLHDGRVLVTGGLTEAPVSPTPTAEIFDAAKGTWTFTGSMRTGRSDHAAVVLRDGQVLVAGGTASELRARFASAEIFDPDTGNWTLTGDMTSPRSEAEYAAVLLPDGRVLVPGGYIAHETATSSADLYDPETGTWAPAGFMSNPRTGHVAIVLPGNRGVLVMGGLMGGATHSVATNSVNIFELCRCPDLD
jgi:N-acetylneuraminic acid mutarotase